jgi:hypothetical protein
MSKWCWGRDSNPRRRMSSDLQSDAVGHFATPAWVVLLGNYITIVLAGKPLWVRRPWALWRVFALFLAILSWFDPTAGLWLCVRL